MPAPKTTTAAPAATTTEKAPEPQVRTAPDGKKVMALGEHEVELPDPDKARTPAELLKCFTNAELDAYADCCSHGLSGDERVPERDLAKFIWRCMRAQFDPFAGEVVGVWRFDKRVGKKVMAWQPEVRGYIASAQRAGRLLAIGTTEFGPMISHPKMGDRQVPEWFEVPLTYKDREGNENQHRTRIYFDEFFVETNSIWREKPRHMGRKRSIGHGLLECLGDLFGGDRTGGSGGDEEDDGRSWDDERPAPRSQRDEPASPPVVPVTRGRPALPKPTEAPAASGVSS